MVYSNFKFNILLTLTNWEEGLAVLPVCVSHALAWLGSGVGSRLGFEFPFAFVFAFAFAFMFVFGFGFGSGSGSGLGLGSVHVRLEL